jgi:hypothetical protein
MLIRAFFQWPGFESHSATALVFFCCNHSKLLGNEPLPFCQFPNL